MEKGNKIALCSALHDPDGALILALQKVIPFIKENYSGWSVVVSKDTSKKVIDELTGGGITVITAGEMTLSPDPIENNHLLAIREGIDSMGDDQYLQYTDGDRVIFGSAYFPDSWRQTLEEVDGRLVDSDYLSLTRSPKDNFTHHAAMTSTEPSFTCLYQMAMGVKVDPASTAHVFSKRAGQFLLDNSASHKPTSFPHGKWEILMKEGGFTVGAVETSDILSYETPLQSAENLTADAFIAGNFAPDLAQQLREAYKDNQLPSLEALREYYNFTVETEDLDSPNEWRRRIEIAEEWIDYLQKELSNLKLPEEVEDGVLAEIEVERKKLIEIRELKSGESLIEDEEGPRFPVK